VWEFVCTRVRRWQFGGFRFRFDLWLSVVAFDYGDGSVNFRNSTNNPNRSLIFYFEDLIHNTNILIWTGAAENARKMVAMFTMKWPAVSLF